MIGRKGIRQRWFARPMGSQDRQSSGQERMGCLCHLLIGCHNGGNDCKGNSNGNGYYRNSHNGNGNCNYNGNGLIFRPSVTTVQGPLLAIGPLSQRDAGIYQVVVINKLILINIFIILIKIRISIYLPLIDSPSIIIMIMMMVIIIAVHSK